MINKMKYSLFSIFLIALIASCSNNKNANIPVEPTATNIDSLLTLYPDSVSLLLFRGNNALKEYRFYDALSDGARAFRLDSMNTDVRMLYGQALNNKDNRSRKHNPSLKGHTPRREWLEELHPWAHHWPP